MSRNVSARRRRVVGVDIDAAGANGDADGDEAESQDQVRDEDWRVSRSSVRRSKYERSFATRTTNGERRPSTAGRVLLCTRRRCRNKRSVPAQRLQTIEQVHHRAHEEGAQAQSKHRAETRCSEPSPKTPRTRGPGARRAVAGAHARRLERDVVAVVELPAAIRPGSGPRVELRVQRRPAIRRQNAEERHVDADLVELSAIARMLSGVSSSKPAMKPGHDADAAIVQRSIASGTRDPVLPLVRVARSARRDSRCRGRSRCSRSAPSGRGARRPARCRSTPASATTLRSGVIRRAALGVRAALTVRLSSQNQTTFRCHQIAEAGRSRTSRARPSTGRMRKPGLRVGTVQNEQVNGQPRVACTHAGTKKRSAEGRTAASASRRIGGGSPLYRRGACPARRRRGAGPDRLGLADHDRCRRGAAPRPARR